MRIPKIGEMKMDRLKSILITAALSVMAGALIIMTSAQHPRFYDVFTRVIDVFAYWFLIQTIYCFVRNDRGQH